MDFQPAVSIMSVAWLKTKVLRTVTHFYKSNAQTHGREKSRQGKITVEEQLHITRQTL